MTEIPDHSRYYEESPEYQEMLEGQASDDFAGYLDLFNEFVGPGQKVLDVGCGVGTSTYLLRGAGFEAVGSDIGQGLPDEPGFLKINFEDASELAAGSFDAVGAMNVLEHVGGPRVFLAEMVRVCRPGGHVIVSSPNLTSPLVPVRIVLDLARGRTPYLGITSYIRALALLGRNLFRSLRCAVGRSPFEARADTISSGIVGYDVDAIYWTNAAEVARHLAALGCDVVGYQGVARSRFARLIAKVLPSFAGQLVVVGRRRG